MKTAFLHWLRGMFGKSAHSPTRMSFTRHQVYVHPCVIDNRPHIVYPRGLAAAEPKLFQSLQRYYRGKGYALKEDRRAANATPRAMQERRRRWVPILLFTTDLLFEGAAFADTNTATPDSHAPAQRQVELLLAASNPHHHMLDKPDAAPHKTKRQATDSAAAGRVYDLLRRRYERRDSDPDYILADLREIADYYSGFPEIVGILDRLNDKNWRLEYNETHWLTVARGNVFQVDSASVQFNTRSAAQLKMHNHCKDNPVCIASPADALLHELLHAHSMLVNTHEFLAQGGMNTVMYPYKHEYAIIDAERKLYASMSHRDAVKRPQRVDHTGRLVKAQCPTCIN